MDTDPVKSGEELRFGFGKNWSRFLSVLNEERIREAEKSLQKMLSCERLDGRSFLDIGSGSGLFSLAARRLGATVRSFDYDRQSVACTEELKHRYYPDDSRWEVMQGSVLDREFVDSLGSFDIVYSWGVLHHTGNMWQALEHAAGPVKEGGLLFIALYNDQGVRSAFWKQVKKLYCSGFVGAVFTSALFFPWVVTACFCKDILCLKNPVERYRQYKKNRGMSIVYDWLGGYPFEVATTEEICAFYSKRHFQPITVVTTRGWGNNEFVFQKNSRDDD